MFAGAMTLTGCSNFDPEDQIYRIENDEVVLFVKDEFEQKFKKKGFIAEDFSWDNISKNDDGDLDIIYYDWCGRSKPYFGMMKIRLEETGEQNVQEAIKHFSSLDFVYNAKADIDSDNPPFCVIKNREIYNISYIMVTVNKEYKQDFLDLALNKYIDRKNVLAIEYSEWVEKEDREYGAIEVFLKKRSYKETIALTEYLNTLEFVESTNNIYQV